MQGWYEVEEQARGAVFEAFGELGSTFASELSWSRKLKFFRSKVAKRHPAVPL